MCSLTHNQLRSTLTLIKKQKKNKKKKNMSAVTEYNCFQNVHFCVINLLFLCDYGCISTYRNVLISLFVKEACLPWKAFRKCTERNSTSRLVYVTLNLTERVTHQHIIEPWPTACYATDCIRRITSRKTTTHLSVSSNFYWPIFMSFPLKLSFFFLGS